MTTTERWNDFVHTGPGTVAGGLMRRFWHPVYASEELPRGRAKPIRIMSEDFTLYRGESGEAHVMDFRCAHRGSRLHTGWVEGDDVRCMYHGWKYGPDGQCTEQPGEPEPFCHKIRIRSYPTREYLGLIFVYFGEGDPPELPRYPRFDRDGIKYVTRYRRRCNYFNNMDNDPIHVFFTHSRTIASWRDGKVLPQISAEEDAHGVVHVARNSDGTINSSYHLFPNMAYREARTQARGGREPRGDNVNWKVPIADHLHEVFNVEWFPHGELNESYLRRKKEREASHPHDDRAQIVDRIFSGELYWHDFPVDHGDSHFTNNVEDEVTQAGQGLIADRTTEHLGRTDVPVIIFRKVWERELRAFAEGLPLKQWVPPGDYE